MTHIGRYAIAPEGMEYPQLKMLDTEEEALRYAEINAKMITPYWKRRTMIVKQQTEDGFKLVARIEATCE